MITIRGMAMDAGAPIDIRMFRQGRDYVIEVKDSDGTWKIWDKTRSEDKAKKKFNQTQLWIDRSKHEANVKP